MSVLGKAAGGGGGYAGRFLDVFACFNGLRICRKTIPQPVRTRAPLRPRRYSFVSSNSVQDQSISPASLAYAEVLIAEIALRNRERIALLLPILLPHYR